jgi:hypothetical protein
MDLPDGSTGKHTYKKHHGNGWHGLISDYYLGSQCFFLIGDIGAGHTISINQCDKETDLATEKKILLNLLSRSRFTVNH